MTIKDDEERGRGKRRIGYVDKEGERRERVGENNRNVQVVKEGRRKGRKCVEDE